MKSTLIKTRGLVDAARQTIQPNAFIAVEGDLISGVGSLNDRGDREGYGQVIDLSGQLVLPGLINSHGDGPSR